MSREPVHFHTGSGLARETSPQASWFMYTIQFKCRGPLRVACESKIDAKPNNDLST